MGVPREGVQGGLGLGRAWPEMAQDTGQSPLRGIWEGAEAVAWRAQTGMA